MFEFLESSQTSILIGCGLFSALMALFVMAINFRSFKKKIALIKLEFGVSLLLVSDAVGIMFQGYGGDFGNITERAANFLVFSLTLANIFFLNEYITALFMETGKFDKLPKRFKLGFILPSIGLVFVVISQFTGIYYSFDADNYYQRGPLFGVSFLIPFATVNLLFSFVIQYRRLINRRLLLAISIFSVFPMLAGVIQVFFYGLSLINFATWLAAVALFWFALSDQNDEMLNAANSDLLTKLPNSFGYIYEVDKIINQHKITSYTAFYFDVVKMTQYNNKYGRVLGDEIILNYSMYIKNSLDKEEVMGRLGGDFFVALIKNENVQKFIKLLGDVPVEIEYEGEKVVLHLAAVAGIYEIKEKINSGGQLITNTAIAINYAKNVAHKPYVYLDNVLENRINQMNRIDSDARNGIKTNEFVPFYQPKVDSKTNKVIGAEALVRWNKNGEIVAPFFFVPALEKSGTICDLDFYMLEHVCADIKSWIERGLEPVQVSVNFSRRNLGNPILAEAISKVVEKYNIPKEFVQIEITETLDEYPMSYLIGVVEALQRYGLTVAIDDFGTGSSSIGLLKLVKFDVLKIDRSFVDYKDENGKLLLEDIIHLVHNIGIKVVAEGVEEMERVEELKKMKCYCIQGYVYDKPLSKGVFEDKLLNKQYLV